MKKQTLLIIFLLISATLTGCQSPGRNPAGVYGTTGLDDAYGTAGMIPLAGRFTGGTEHPGMFTSVLFAYDSSQVSASERAKIETVAQRLKQNPAEAVIIEGHCDERGSREYNLALGERRALAIRAYLAGLGIEADRIQTKSLGEESPAALEHNESAWRLNRRGEFVLYY
jgi:peptidoglycan-associated lipoprotein